jgi:adenylate cyclase
MTIEAPLEARAFEAINWLCSDECHDLDDAGMIAGLGSLLRALGLSIDRIGLHLRTLHPQILARSILWSPDEPVQIIDRESIPGFRPQPHNNPLIHVRETREWVVQHSDDGSPLLDWFDVYKARKIMGFVAAPLAMGQGPAGVAVFATKSAAKFDCTAIAKLRQIVPALRNACEIRQLRRAEVALLDTYVGRATGRRVLAGSIRRGNVETLEAALLVCDLRDFTAMSNRVPPDEMLNRLNLYFDQVVPAITAAGGEILKFMGDAVLAFFHFDDGPSVSCAAAFDAAREALSRLDAISQAGNPLLAGVALHHGKVAYGNVGSAERLDFTLIGSDVNLVSRIQDVCAMTGHPLLMSSRFAALLGRSEVQTIGKFPLKGFSEQVELLAWKAPHEIIGDGTGANT